MSDEIGQIKSEKPIFLTGVYRSGTTLITQILDVHSQLSVTFDTVQYLRYYFSEYNPKNDYTTIVEDVCERLSDRYSIQLDKNKILSEIRNSGDLNHANIYNSIMREFFSDETPERWGEKSVLEWSNISTFFEMFPQGQAIHIIRDPRDVLASYKVKTIEEEYRYLDAVFACLGSFNWLLNNKSEFSDKQLSVVRHEDLVIDPVLTVQQLCEFLQIPFEEKMLKTKLFKTRNRERDWDPNTAFDDFGTGEGISQQSVGRWEEVLNAHEVAFAESILGTVMEEFDYEMSKKKIEPSDLSVLLKKISGTPLIQQRLERWQNTGKGVEEYPSDPREPSNWDE